MNYPFAWPDPSRRPLLGRGRAAERRTLHQSRVGILFDQVAPYEAPPPPGVSTGFLVVLPYQGAFNYHVGSKVVTCDPAVTLFVTPNQDYRDTHPAVGVGHQSLILRMSCPLLDELCGTGGPARNPAFAVASALATPRVQMLTFALKRAEPGSLAMDELLIAAAAEALREVDRAPPRRPGRLAQKAKDYLHAVGSERVRLEDIAAALDVSPVYLTNAFRAAEGIPLAKYQMRLRLAEALRLLPLTGDITSLALDLGFSSHSHFTAAFHSYFGVPPSQYRDAAQGGLQ